MKRLIACALFLLVLAAFCATVAPVSSQGVAHKFSGCVQPNATLSTNGGRVCAGTGSPEGAFNGWIGDTYLRRDGGANTSCYFKESGNNTTTGWVACRPSSSGFVTASSTDTLTNKTLDAEGTGNSITFPFTYTYVVGVCQGTSFSLGVSLPTSNPAVGACVTGTNTQLAVAEFADGSNLSVQGHFSLTDWSGNIDVSGKWRTSATSGDVKWQVATICVADAETVDPSFNTASTTTETAKGTTLQLNDFSIASITVTGCASGEELFWKFFRDASDGSDTMAATAQLLSLVFTVRRTV